jgi:hypothetical protein
MFRTLPGEKKKKTASQGGEGGFDEREIRERLQKKKQNKTKQYKNCCLKKCATTVNP